MMLSHKYTRKYPFAYAIAIYLNQIRNFSHMFFVINIFTLGIWHNAPSPRVIINNKNIVTAPVRCNLSWIREPNMFMITLWIIDNSKLILPSYTKTLFPNTLPKTPPFNVNDWINTIVKIKNSPGTQILSNTLHDIIYPRKTKHW